MPISLTSLGTAYTQDFNTLSNVAGSTTNNLTINGWSLTEAGGGVRDNEQYAVDDGGSVTGDTYSYGAAGSTERALGGLQSGTLIPLFGASFTNDTGSTITTLAISYTGEEWHLGTAGRTDQLTFEYSTNATDLTTGTWTNVSALNFVTPDTATVGAKDGNSAGDSTSLSATITSLNITAGATFWIRWTDTDATSNDDGLAVDNFSLTPQVTPLQFNNLNNSPTFFEDGSFVTLDNNAVIQNAATFNGATLTLQRDGGASLDDFFTSAFLTPDGDVDLGGGNVIGSYFLSGGVLSITFNQFADANGFNSVLESLQYGNFNNNPPSQVQIDYSFNDTVSTATGHITVNIIPENDPPTLNGVSASSVWAAGSGPVILSPGASVSDPDSANLTVATVRITNGFGGDTLTADAGTTGIAVTYNPATFTLTLSGAHTLAQYQQVLDTVAYGSTDTDPTGGGAHPTRNISWQVGDTGSEANSNVQTTLLEYAPLLDLDQSGAGTGFTGNFTEGGSPVAIADIDDFVFTSNDFVVSAVITLTDAHPGDDLNYDNSVGSISGSKDTSDPTKIIVTLSSEGQSASLFQTALQHVFFSNTSENPDPSARHITVVVTDSVTTSNTALDLISVTPVDDPPQAQDGTLNAHANHAASGAAVATDPDNSPGQLSYSLTGGNGGALHGTVVMNSDGSFTYTPNTNYSGPDGFAFTASDGQATSNQGTITVSVAANHAPVAQNGTATGNEDAPIAGAAAATDSDGDSIAFALSGTNGGAQHGTVSMDAAGNFTYTPAANFNGTDSFSFTANDGSADSNTATVSLTVNAVNDPPVFAHFGTAHSSGTEQTFAVINGAATVADIELDAKSGGTGGYAGASVIIGRAGSGGPNPADTFFFGGVGMAFTVDTLNHALLSNGQQFATYNIPSSGAQAGTIAVNFNGLNTPATTALVNNVLQHISYKNQSDTPPASVMLHWTFNDGNFNNAQGSGGNLQDNANRIVDITPVDDAPVAQNGSASGNEDTTINGTLVASDVDSASLNFSSVTNPAHGTVTVNADGTFSYTPGHDFNGSDSFTFKASDGSLDSNVATVSLTVNPVNDPPAIVSNGGGDTASLSIAENTTAVTTVVATDPESAALTYSIVGGSDAGKFQIDASTGALAFIAAPDFENPADADHNNSYIVQVRASDGSLSDDQAITVAVTDVSEIVPKVHWSASVDAGAHTGVFGPTAAPIDRWVTAGIGDFNGDATSDLAWYNSVGNKIDIWELANGQLGASVATGAHPAGYQPAGFGDFNHDGTGDILWFNPTTHDVDLWKISNGQWAGSVDIGTHPAGYAPSGVGDFNNDGTSDVLWFNAATRDVDIWKISDGHWAGSVDVGAHPAGYQPALTGDFNGDGTSDVAWYDPTTGDVDIWKISNGQWAGSVDVGSHPAGWQPLGAADFNKDGTSDIAWYNPTTNDIDIWLMANGQWAGSVDIGNHPAGSTAVGVGDFDHNSVSDIMWLNNTTGHIDNWLLAFG